MARTKTNASLTNYVNTILTWNENHFSHFRCCCFCCRFLLLLFSSFSSLFSFFISVFFDFFILDKGLQHTYSLKLFWLSHSFVFLRLLIPPLLRFQLIRTNFLIPCMLVHTYSYYTKTKSHFWYFIIFCVPS